MASSQTSPSGSRAVSHEDENRKSRSHKTSPNSESHDKVDKHVFQPRLMRTDEIIVSAEVIVFFIVGGFGNFHLLWTTIRKKALQSKPGILLGINAASHLICLFGETFNAAFLISRTSVTRRTCFLLISPYIFAISNQAVMTLAISADLLYALLFPVWYRVLPTLTYIIIVFGICSAYALVGLISGLMNLDDEIIWCNVPLALPPLISRYWSLSNVFINVAVLMIYAITIGSVYRKAKSQACHEHWKVLQRLKVITIVFVFSWCIAILGVDIAHVLDFSPEFFAIWQSNMVFFALICYSQTFYVCIWRSKEYRSAFKEQLYLLAYRKISDKHAASVSTVCFTRVNTLRQYNKSNNNKSNNSKSTWF